jgi:hypothetical protein
VVIRLPSGPINAPTAIGKAMNDLGLRGSHSAFVSPTIKASQPIPVFVLQLDEIGDGFLGRARRWGWRYLLIDTGSAADVNDKAEFHSISHGELPARLMEACERASAMFEQRPEQFEPRILEIPALYVVTLWIFGPEQTFFCLLDLDGIPALQPLAQAEFETHVIALAERARTEPADKTTN